MLQTQVDINLNVIQGLFIILCFLSCLLLPWLVICMLELITIAVPATIFFSLLGVYLYFKVNKSFVNTNSF